MPEETTSKLTNNKVLWIDPPEGWRYGFPRELPEGIEGDAIIEWMIECGYPKEKMITHDTINPTETESTAEHFYFRTWYEEKG